MIALAKHMWLRTSHINWFPFHHLFPLAIINFYTILLKAQFKPPVLSLAPQYLSNQVWYPHLGSYVNHTFHSYSILCLYISCPVHILLLCFKLFTIGCNINTSFSFNANPNCMLSSVLNKELDFLHKTIWKPPKPFSFSEYTIYNLYNNLPFNYILLIYSFILNQCIGNQ